MTGTALIIGVSGQDGAYLAQQLLESNYRVIGTTTNSKNRPLLNLVRLGVIDKIEIVQLKLPSVSRLDEMIKEVRPTEIYNLSGPSSVAESIVNPSYVTKSLIDGTLCVLESIRKNDPSVRYYNACSVECFGDFAGEPATEITPFSPKSPYGIAKSACFELTKYYRSTFSIFAASGILTNHESPLRGDDFVSQKIVTGALRISRGLSNHLVLGNINVVRDWGWAPEFVQGIRKIVGNDEPDDFILGTGESHSLKEFVDLAFLMLDLDWQDHVQIDKTKSRNCEILLSRVDPSKANRYLSWSPEIKLENVIKKLVSAKKTCDLQTICNWS